MASLSLIKEALDKAQEEGPQPDPENLPPEVNPGEPSKTTDSQIDASQSMKMDLSTVITSVVIIILAALIGGQIVLLASVFLF